MTINYTLYLATDAKPEDATEALRPFIEESPEDASSGQTPAGMSWLPDGPVSIIARPLDFLPAIAEENGIAAKLAVDFELLAEEVVEAKPVMLRYLLALLAELPGDAVFHDVADNIVLRRRGGKLELNLSCSFWTPELRALVPWPFDADAGLLSACEAFADEGRWTEALFVARKALERAPESPRAWSVQGRALAGLDQAEEAERSLDEALRLAPEDGAALSARAALRLRRKDEAGALSDLEALLKILPAGPERDALRKEANTLRGHAP